MENKLQKGIEILNATPTDDGYIYLAEETDDRYFVTEAEVIRLAEMHEKDPSTAYSEWCTMYGEVVGDQS